MTSRTRPSAESIAGMSALNRAARSPEQPLRGDGHYGYGTTPAAPAPRKSRAKKPAGPRISEHAEQVAVIQWWASYCGTMGLDIRLLFAIPNGGARSEVTGAMLKAEGVRPAVPDLMLALPLIESVRVKAGEVFGTFRARDFSGMFVEMKAGNGDHNKAQREYADLLRRHGYNCIVAYGATEAIRAIKAYCERAKS